MKNVTKTTSDRAKTTWKQFVNKIKQDDAVKVILAFIFLPISYNIRTAYVNNERQFRSIYRLYYIIIYPQTDSRLNTKLLAR